MEDRAEIPQEPSGEETSPFQQMREAVHAQMEEDLQKRLAKGTPATREEALIGAFREMLEPQVRDAIFELFRKGYATENSGFYGENGRAQEIDGVFTLDEETRTKLEALGVEVLSDADMGRIDNEGRTYLRFIPESTSMQKMTHKWNQIAALLPDRGQHAEPSMYGLDFQEEYAREHTDIFRARIERILRKQSDYMSPERRQELERTLEGLEA